MASITELKNIDESICLSPEGDHLDLQNYTNSCSSTLGFEIKAIMSGMRLEEGLPETTQAPLKPRSPFLGGSTL